MSFTQVQLTLDTKPILDSLASTQAAMENFAKNISGYQVKNDSLEKFNKSVDETIKILQKIEVSKLSDQLTALRDGFKVVATEVLKLKGAAVDLRDITLRLAGLQRYLEKIQKNGGTVSIAVSFKINIDIDKDDVKLNSIKSRVAQDIKSAFGALEIHVPITPTINVSQIRQAISGIGIEDRSVALIASRIVVSKEVREISVVGRFTRFGLAANAKIPSLGIKGVINEVVLSKEIADKPVLDVVVPVKGIITELDISDDQRKKLAEAGEIPAISFKVEIGEEVIKSLRSVNSAARRAITETATTITKDVADASAKMYADLNTIIPTIATAFNNLKSAGDYFKEQVNNATKSEHTIKVTPVIDDSKLRTIALGPYPVYYEPKWGMGARLAYNRMMRRIYTIATRPDEAWTVEFMMQLDEASYNKTKDLVEGLKKLAEGIDFSQLKSDISSLQTTINSGKYQIKITPSLDVSQLETYLADKTIKVDADLAVFNGSLTTALNSDHNIKLTVNKKEFQQAIEDASSEVLIPQKNISLKPTLSVVDVPGFLASVVGAINNHQTPLQLSVTLIPSLHERFDELVKGCLAAAEQATFSVKAIVDANEAQTAISTAIDNLSTTVVLDVDADVSAVEEAIQGLASKTVKVNITPEEQQGRQKRGWFSSIFGSGDKHESEPVEQTIQFKSDMSQVNTDLDTFETELGQRVFNVTVTLTPENVTTTLEELSQQLSGEELKLEIASNIDSLIESVERLEEEAKDKLKSIRDDLSNTWIAVQFKSVGLNFIEQEIQKIKEWMASNEFEFHWKPFGSAEDSEKEEGAIARLSRMDVASIQTLNITGDIQNVKQIGPIGHAEQIGPIGSAGQIGPINGNGNINIPPTAPGGAGGSNNDDNDGNNGGGGVPNESINTASKVGYRERLSALGLEPVDYDLAFQHEKPLAWVNFKGEYPSEEDRGRMEAEQISLIENLTVAVLHSIRDKEQGNKQIEAVLENMAAIKAATEYLRNNWSKIERSKKQREAASRHIKDIVGNESDVNDLRLRYKPFIEKIQRQAEEIGRELRGEAGKGSSPLDNDGEKYSRHFYAYFWKRHLGQKPLTQQPVYEGEARDINKGYGLHSKTIARQVDTESGKEQRIVQRIGEFRLPDEVLERKFRDVQSQIYDGILPSKKQIDSLRESVTALMPTVEELKGRGYKSYKEWFNSKYGIQMDFAGLTDRDDKNINKILRNYSGELITASKVFGLVPGSRLKTFGDLYGTGKDITEVAGEFNSSTSRLSLNQNRTIEENMGTIWHEVMHAVFDQVMYKNPDAYQKFRRYYKGEADDAHQRIDHGAAWVSPYAYSPVGSYDNIQELPADAAQQWVEGGATNKAIQAVVALASRLKYLSEPSFEEQVKHGTVVEDVSDDTLNNALTKIANKLQVMSNDYKQIEGERTKLERRLGQLKEVFDTVVAKTPTAVLKDKSKTIKSINDQFANLRTTILPGQDKQESQHSLTPPLFDDDTEPEESSLYLSKSREAAVRIEAANQIASAGKNTPLLLTYDPNAIQKALGPNATTPGANPPVEGENIKNDAERIENANELIKKEEESIKKEDTINEQEKQVVDKAAQDATEIIKAAGDDIADTVEKTVENIEKTVEEETRKPVSPKKLFINPDFDRLFDDNGGGNNPPPSPPGGGGGNGPRGPRGPNGPNGPNDGSFGMSGLANASWDARRAMDLMFSKETVNRIDKFREAIAKLLEHMLALADAVERVKKSEVINLAIRTSGSAIAGAPRVSAPRGGAPAGPMVDRRRHSESVLPFGTDPTGTTSPRIIELQRAFRAMYYDARRLSTVVRNFFSTGVVANGLKQIISMAADAEENFAKFEIVFENTMDTANKAFKNLTENYRLSDTTAKKMLADTGNLLIGFGIPEAEAAKMSAQLQVMASDLALFTNYEGRTEGASVALTKAIYGRREAAKRLGLAITESAVKERMAALIATGYAQSTEKGTKALATIQIMQEQAAKAYGTTARETQHFWAQVDALRASFENLKVKFGNAIKDVATVFVKSINTIVKAIGQLPEPVMKAGILLAGLMSGVMAAGMSYVGLMVWFQSLKRTLTFASTKLYEHTVALKGGQAAAEASSKAIEAQTAILNSNKAVTGEAVDGVNTLASAQEAESVIRQLATDVVNTETAAIQANTAAKLANADVQPVTAQAIMSESVNQFNMMAARKKDADKGLNALGLPGPFPRDKKTRETIATIDGVMNGSKTGPHYDGNGNMVRNVDFSAPDDYYEDNRHFKTASGVHSPKVQELYYNTERAMERGNRRGVLEGYDEQVIVGRTEDGQPIFDTKHRDVLKYAPDRLSAVDSRGEVNEQIAGQIAKQRGIYKDNIDTKVKNRTEELVSGIRNGKYSSQVSLDAGLMGIRVNDSEDKVNSLKAELEERIKSSGWLTPASGEQVQKAFTMENIRARHDEMVQARDKLQALVNDESLSTEKRFAYQQMLDRVEGRITDIRKFMKDTSGLQKQISAAEREFKENSSALYNRIEGQVRSGNVKDISGLGRQTFEVEGLGSGTAEHLAAKAANINTLDNSEIVRSQNILRRKSSEKIFHDDMRRLNESITDESLENTPEVREAYNKYFRSIDARDSLPRLESELAQANGEVSRLQGMLDSGQLDETERGKYAADAQKVLQRTGKRAQRIEATNEEIERAKAGYVPTKGKAIGHYKNNTKYHKAGDIKYRPYREGEYLSDLEKKLAILNAQQAKDANRYTNYQSLSNQTGAMTEEQRTEITKRLETAKSEAAIKQAVRDAAQDSANNLQANKQNYEATKEDVRRQIFSEGEAAAKGKHFRQRFQDENATKIFNVQPDGSYTTDENEIARNKSIVKTKRKKQDVAVRNWKLRDKANKNRERQKAILNEMGLAGGGDWKGALQSDEERIGRLNTYRDNLTAKHNKRISRIEGRRAQNALQQQVSREFINSLDATTELGRETIEKEQKHLAALEAEESLLASRIKKEQDLHTKRLASVDDQIKNTKQRLGKFKQVEQLEKTIAKQEGKIRGNEFVNPNDVKQEVLEYTDADGKKKKVVATPGVVSDDKIQKGITPSDREAIKAEWKERVEERRAANEKAKAGLSNADAGIVSSSGVLPPTNGPVGPSGPSGPDGPDWPDWPDGPEIDPNTKKYIDRHNKKLAKQYEKEYKEKTFGKQGSARYKRNQRLTAAGNVLKNKSKHSKKAVKNARRAIREESARFSRRKHMRRLGRLETFRRINSVSGRQFLTNKQNWNPINALTLGTMGPGTKLGALVAKSFASVFGPIGKMMTKMWAPLQKSFSIPMQYIKVFSKIFGGAFKKMFLKLIPFVGWASLIATAIAGLGQLFKRLPRWLEAFWWKYGDIIKAGFVRFVKKIPAILEKVGVGLMMSIAYIANGVKEIFLRAFGVVTETQKRYRNEQLDKGIEDTQRIIKQAQEAQQSLYLIYEEYSKKILALAASFGSDLESITAKTEEQKQVIEQKRKVEMLNKELEGLKQEVTEGEGDLTPEELQAFEKMDQEGLAKFIADRQQKLSGVIARASALTGQMELNRENWNVLANAKNDESVDEVEITNDDGTKKKVKRSQIGEEMRRLDREYKGNPLNGKGGLLSQKEDLDKESERQRSTIAMLQQGKEKEVNIRAKEIELQKELIDLNEKALKQKQAELNLAFEQGKLGSFDENGNFVRNDAYVDDTWKKYNTPKEQYEASIRNAARKDEQAAYEQTNVQNLAERVAAVNQYRAGYENTVAEQGLAQRALAEIPQLLETQKQLEAQMAPLAEQYNAASGNVQLQAEIGARLAQLNEQYQTTTGQIQKIGAETGYGPAGERSLDEAKQFIDSAADWFANLPVSISDLNNAAQLNVDYQNAQDDQEKKRQEASQMRKDALNAYNQNVISWQDKFAKIMSPEEVVRMQSDNLMQLKQLFEQAESSDEKMSIIEQMEAAEGKIDKLAESENASSVAITKGSSEAFKAENKLYNSYQNNMQKTVRQSNVYLKQMYDEMKAQSGGTFRLKTE